MQNNKCNDFAFNTDKLILGNIMIAETITVTKDEMFEVIKAYQILTNFIEKHYKIEDIYTENFLLSMSEISNNQNDRLKINNFDDFINWYEITIQKWKIFKRQLHNNIFKNKFVSQLTIHGKGIEGAKSAALDLLKLWVTEDINNVK